MKSKNKPAQTKAEAAHVSKLADMPCVVCGGGPEGWHGTRLRWKLRKMDELKAINETLRMVLI